MMKEIILKEFFKKNSLKTKKIITQQEFLKSNGIIERAEILAKKMKFRDQTSLKRLTKNKRDSLTNKPSLIAMLLLLLAFLQVPTSLKSSINIFCLFSETSESNKTLFFCND